MDVPQVDVLVRDLHGALSVDVQVGGGHQVHVEPLWKWMRGRSADADNPNLSPGAGDVWKLREEELMHEHEHLFKSQRD